MRPVDYTREEDWHLTELCDKSHVTHWKGFLVVILNKKNQLEYFVKHSFIDLNYRSIIYNQWEEKIKFLRQITFTCFSRVK